MDRKELLRKSLAHNWHPYPQMSALAADPPLQIDRAEGLFLFDADGNRYYDAISSWWCVVHGHGHPRIREGGTGFVCLDRGYHGDTTGCMSVSGVEAFLRAFRPILFPARRVPAPYCYRCPEGKRYPECGVSCVDALGDALREGRE